LTVTIVNSPSILVAKITSASWPESLASIFSITGNTLGSLLSILMASLNHQLRVIIHDPHKVLRGRL
jgi:hypothetical protein